MTGTVKWFDTKRGYGFINGDDGKEYFVHQSNIQMKGFRKLDECDIVDFEVGIGGNGYDSEWTDKAKKSGTTVDEFIDNYEDEHMGEVVETPLQGTFKYLVMDDCVSCGGDYEDLHYEPNIWEIANSLARESSYWKDSKRKAIETYQNALDDLNKNLKNDAMNFRLALSEPTTEIPS